MVTTTPLKTRQQVRDEFARKGIRVSDWSLQHGFKPHNVYAIINDDDSNSRRKCLRGESLRIAAALALVPSTPSILKKSLFSLEKQFAHEVKSALAKCRGPQARGAAMALMLYDSGVTTPEAALESIRRQLGLAKPVVASADALSDIACRVHHPDTTFA